MNCNKSDIETFMTQFEICTLPQAQWTHQAHLTVALWYLLKEPFPDATQRIRTGIQRYNAAKGIVMTPTTGYHETLTVFWISVIHQYLQRHGEGDRATLLDGLLEVYADPQLPLQYYSRDRLMSWEARTTWLKPDLEPLPD